MASKGKYSGFDENGFKESLREAAEAVCSVGLDENALGRFYLYAELLAEWNGRMNLTAITDGTGIIYKHFADSISVLANFDIPQGETVIDVGTGAGFPGLPLKIVRDDIDLTLLDSLNKRIGFLDAVTDELGLDKVRRLHMRAEEGGREPGLRERFGLCVSRAVARLDMLSEYCLPYVKLGGCFIAMKGAETAGEINEAKEKIKLLGGEVSEVKTVELKLDSIRHSLVIIRKVRQTPSGFPRTQRQMTKDSGK